MTSQSTTAPPPSTTAPPPTLRLMCSYGGHILPRPHDKTLTYIGGHTRLITSPRHTTLPNLITRLATTLTYKSCINTSAFRLKYLLPYEDLDSLISVANEDDLENMFEEHERVYLSHSRLRLFLFPENPEDVNVDYVNSVFLEGSGISEEWFVNVLNGGSGFFNTNNNGSLLGFDDEVDIVKETVTEKAAEKEEKEVKVLHDVLSVPESLVVETTSSDDDQEKEKVVAVAVLSNVITGVQNNVGFDMMSPNSVSSDGSLTNQLSRHKLAIVYQDQSVQTELSNISNNDRRAGDARSINDQNSRIQLQQLTQGDPQHVQLNHQPHFIHAALPPPQYIRHPYGAVPMVSSYPMYAAQSQPHGRHSGLDQRNFVYYMPVRPIQTQPTLGYTLPLQGDTSPAISAPSTSQEPTPYTLFTATQTVKTAEPVTKPESPACRTNNFGASGPQLVQVPSSQHQLQPQYVAYSQIQQPSQIVASSGGGNYAYQFTYPLQQGQHIYYATQPMPPQSAAQHQTMTSALPVESGSHLQTDNSMKQQVKTSQP